MNPCKPTRASVTGSGKLCLGPFKHVQQGVTAHTIAGKDGCCCQTVGVVHNGGEKGHECPKKWICNKILACTCKQLCGRTMTFVMANSSSLLAEQAKQGIQMMLVSLFKAGDYIELLSLNSTC